MRKLELLTYHQSCTGYHVYESINKTYFVPANFYAQRASESIKVKKVKQTESKIRRAVFARLDENEDLLSAIRERAEQNGISAGFFFLIGTLKKAVLGFYKSGNYKPISVSGPLEIACCIGNISEREDGELVAHAHLAVSNEQGVTFGGHLLPGCPVDVTGELVLFETPDAKLKRILQEKLNLYLWSLE